MRLAQLAYKLEKFEKENLSDILHTVATGIQSIFLCDKVRVYLEDLHEGMLICHYVTGQKGNDQHHVTKYISPKESITSKAFYENSVVVSWDLEGGLSHFENHYETISEIQATAVFPITYQMRPIGTLNLDWNSDGQYLDSGQCESIISFLADNSSIIDRAKRFHQDISFSRHLDLARKKEGAWMMMRSAVNLIEKLTLASVFVPSSRKPSKQPAPSTDLVEILAAYSKNIKDAEIYNNRDQISVLEGHHLINQIVHYEPSKGLLINDRNQATVYRANIMEEQFSRKPIASQINLVSLYQVPKYDALTGRFICAVNYYTSEPYEFTPFEKRLLQEHASRLEELIQEESPTHIEIEVLSEIEELLSTEHKSLQEFLHSILGKTSELLGADCGTISLLQVVDGKPWLIVEDKEGNLIGAKSRGWKKNTIPPLPIGGNDLPDSKKSVNGYCAHTARPVLFNDVHNPQVTQGFYKNMSQSIESELAVPIIYRNNVLGVINQDSFRKNHFTEEHKKILLIVARLIGPQVYNLQQLDEVRRDQVVLEKDIGYRDPKVSSYYLGNVIGKSQRIHTLVKQIDTVAESICQRMLNWGRETPLDTLLDLPCLLITGNTGTGKEFFFNNIYSRISGIFRNAKSDDFQLPLRKTNIAAYSGELTYSELFGHKKGAFTGAESNRLGILEEANGGMVFLDEIGDADPKTQVQLLRFLDTGAFMRLGENQSRYSRIFLVAATNKDLLKEIEKGNFREDLYHRLNAISFHIPPLNERREDIEDLATHFLGRLYQTYQRESSVGAPYQLEASAINLLTKHNYRGNVRELKNILLRSVMFSKSSTLRDKDIVGIDPISLEYSEENRQFPKTAPSDAVLNQLESGQGDFWTHIHGPFRENQITRNTVKEIIDAARERYQANLPGLAVKLRACDERFRRDPEENKKFISFKNFLYKTIKISQN